MSQSTIFQSYRDGATVSLVLTSTLGSECVLLKDTTQCCQWGSNPGYLESESDALPLRCCALSVPFFDYMTVVTCYMYKSVASQIIILSIQEPSLPHSADVQ